jgi:hypothetical protein
MSLDRAGDAAVIDQVIEYTATASKKHVLSLLKEKYGVSLSSSTWVIAQLHYAAKKE